MRSKGRTITSEQGRWRKAVASWANDGYAAQPLETHMFQLHHIWGSSAHFNGIHVGEFAILPVHFELHDPNSNHPLNVTHYPKKFERKFGTQKSIWLSMVESMIENSYWETSANFEILIHTIETKGRVWWYG